MIVRFGPAGKPITLKSKKLKDIPPFLKEKGLDAMEYQAVRSVRISEDKATSFGKLASEYGIVLSLHAPYAINLSSKKKETVEASISRLVASGRAAGWMGAYRVVFHAGYYGDYAPEEALKMVIDALRQVREALDAEGFKKVVLSPETTGRISQVGTLDEVIEMSLKVERCLPTIDFAHIYARSKGELCTSVESFVDILEKIEKEIGKEAVRPVHIHFTEVEYGDSGERCHHPIGSGHGPNFEHLALALIELGYDAVIISESPLLEEDAVKMKEIFKALLAREKK